MEGWLDGQEVAVERGETTGEKSGRGDVWGVREAVRSSGSAGGEGCVVSLSLLPCPFPTLPALMQN
jgi:hypothetical protein